MNETTKIPVDWSAAWAAVRILRRSCEARPGDAEAVALIADYLLNRAAPRAVPEPPSPPEQPEPHAPRRRSPHGKRIQRNPIAPDPAAAPAAGPAEPPADPPPAEPAAPAPGADNLPADPPPPPEGPEDLNVMRKIVAGSMTIQQAIASLKQHGFSQARIARACDLDEAGISSAARGKVFPYIDKRFRQLFRIPPAAPSSGNAAVERYREVHGGA